MMKKTIIAMIICSLPLCLSAQVIKHDKDKENILKSMEGPGYWNFSPSWYMYFLHKNYSGAEAYWRWEGLKSGLHVRFKEEKSNVKSVMPRRAAAIAASIAKNAIVEKEREMIQKLTEEEEKRAADRNIDLVYPKYEDYFNELQDGISACLEYAMKTSKGKLTEQINEVLQQNEIVTSNIKYLRQTGIGNELENAKRDQGFRDQKKLMERVNRQARALAKMAKAFCD